MFRFSKQLAVLVSHDFKTCDGGAVEEVAKSRRASESNGGRREHVKCVQAEQEEAERNLRKLSDLKGTCQSRAGHPQNG